MSTNSQANMSHSQQLKYLNSKFIFYFNDQHKQNSLLNPKLLRNTHNINPKLPSINPNSQKFHTIDQKKLPILSTQRKKHPKPDKQSKPLLPLTFRQNHIQKCPLTHTSQHHLTKIKPQHHQLHKTHQSSQKLSTLQILSLFGKYHQLYQDNIDYLGHLQPLHLKQSSNHQKYHQPNYLSNRKHTQSYLAKNMYADQSQKQNLYAIKNYYHQAPIVPFIINKTLRKVYLDQANRNLQGTIYIDKQFPHKNFKKINGQSIQWIYVSPQSSSKIFSSHPQKCQLTTSNQQINFVKFLKHILKIQPNAILRLLQPPIGNVFCVWLFHNNIFKPIIIDGYFPHNLSNLFHNSNNIIQLAIIIKCICKIYKTYDYQILNKITDQQIYTMLYGQSLIKKPLTQFLQQLSASTQPQLKKYKKHKKLLIKKQKQFYLLNLQGSYHKFGSSNSITCYNLKNQWKQIQSKSASICQIKQPENWHIYSLQTIPQQITTIDINCPTNCNITFRPLLTNQKISIYRYSLQQKTKKKKLLLEHQITHLPQKPCKLTVGYYKIVYNDTMIKKQQQKNKNEQMKQKTKQSLSFNKFLTMMTSVLVKIDKIGEGFNHQNIIGCRSQINQC